MAVDQNFGCELDASGGRWITQNYADTEGDDSKRYSLPMKQ